MEAFLFSISILPIPSFSTLKNVPMRDPLEKSDSQWAHYENAIFIRAPNDWNFSKRIHKRRGFTPTYLPTSTSQISGDPGYSLRLVLGVGKFLLTVAMRNHQMFWSCLASTPRSGTQ